MAHQPGGGRSKKWWRGRNPQQRMYDGEWAVSAAGTCGYIGHFPDFDSRKWQILVIGFIRCEMANYGLHRAWQETDGWVTVLQQSLAMRNIRCPIKEEQESRMDDVTPLTSCSECDGSDEESDDD